MSFSYLLAFFSDILQNFWIDYIPLSLNIHYSILWDTYYFSLWNVKSRWWWLGSLCSYAIISLYLLSIVLHFITYFERNNFNFVSLFLLKRVSNLHISSSCCASSQIRVCEGKFRCMCVSAAPVVLLIKFQRIMKHESNIALLAYWSHDVCDGNNLVVLLLLPFPTCSN